MQICVTRFNNKTLNENIKWRKNNNHPGCIYGTPVKITETILPNTLIIVLEMNNSNNSIEGIGIIKNQQVKPDKKNFKIYNDNNYNRFIYKSNLRIDKKNLKSNYEKKILESLEKLLFTTKNHFKRGHGIQKLPEFIEKFHELNFKTILTNIYKKKFINIKTSNYKIIKNN
jgi:hypothetical protein